MIARVISRRLKFILLYQAKNEHAVTSVVVLFFFCFVCECCFFKLKNSAKSIVHCLFNTVDENG